MAAEQKEKLSGLTKNGWTENKSKKKRLCPDSIELFDLYTEIRALKVQMREIIIMLKEALRISPDNILNEYENQYPFFFPLSTSHVNMFEEILNQGEKYEELVSNIKTFFSWFPSLKGLFKTLLTRKKCVCRTLYNKKN